MARNSNSDWKVVYKRFLRITGACEPACEHFFQTKAETFADFWNSAERIDWMFWLARKLKMDHKLIMTVACRCARSGLKFVKPGEYRPLTVVTTAERWCRYEATIAEVRDAVSVAYAATDSEACAVVCAVASAAFVYAYAPSEGDAAAYVRTEAYKEMCAIIRETFTAELMWKSIEDRMSKV